MPTAPSVRRIIEISFLRIIKWKNFALKEVSDFDCFFNFYLKYFWFKVSKPFQIKNSNFGRDGLLIWFPLHFSFSLIILVNISPTAAEKKFNVTHLIYVWNNLNFTARSFFPSLIIYHNCFQSSIPIRCHIGTRDFSY